MPDVLKMGFGFLMVWIKTGLEKEIYHMKSSIMLSNYEMYKLKIPEVLRVLTKHSSLKKDFILDKLLTFDGAPTPSAKIKYLF